MMLETVIMIIMISDNVGDNGNNSDGLHINEQLRQAEEQSIEAIGEREREKLAIC